MVGKWGKGYTGPKVEAWLPSIPSKCVSYKHSFILHSILGLTQPWDCWYYHTAVAVPSSRAVQRVWDPFFLWDSYAIPSNRDDFKRKKREHAIPRSPAFFLLPARCLSPPLLPPFACHIEQFRAFVQASDRETHHYRLVLGLDLCKNLAQHC